MTQVTIVGNLTEAPELKFTAAGKAVANFTVAESQRIRDADGSWRDGDSTFWRCSIWDTQAENLTESLVKGQRVIVVGEAKSRSFETREGEKRTVIEVTASEVGPSLKWATAKVERTQAKRKATEKAPVDPWGNDSGFGDTDTAPF